MPRWMFEYEPSVVQIAKESQEFYIVEKIIIDMGIYAYLKGVPYPQKGFAEPQAIWAINMVKRSIIEPLKVALKWQFLTSFVAIGISTRKSKINAIQGILEALARVCFGALSGFLLKPAFLCPVAQETRKMVKVFLLEIGITETTSDQISKIFAHILQYDNAYRFRMQDLFSETNKKKLVENPRKEIGRLVCLLFERDDKSIARKIKSLVRILVFILLFTYFKKAFIVAVKSVDIARMAFDEDDRYWVSIRTDYKYFGMEYNERMELVKDKVKPVPVKI